MTKSFDEWFKDTMPNTHKGVGSEKIETFAYETAQDAWNFKQAEVDELQMKLSEDSRVLHNVIDIERKKCEELQKRIDEALIAIGSDDFVDVRVDYSHQIRDIREILKGDSHES